MILLSIFLFVAIAIFLLSIIKFPTLPGKILAVYLICFSTIVFILQITSLLQKMNNQTLFLVFQVGVLVVVVVVWFLKGKPLLFEKTNMILLTKKRNFFRQCFLQYPSVSITVLSAIAFNLFSLLLIWVVAPNSSDAMHTHLSRVGYWLQQGTLKPWETYNAKQLFYPVNGSLQVFWTILFFGTDRLVGYVQWFAGIAATTSVFGISRLMRANRVQASFAAAVWSSFTIVFMQSTSAQLDLVSAALVMVAVYFLLLGLHRECTNAIIFSGLSIALALGTKQITAFYLPGLFVFCLILLRYWKRQIKRMVIWAFSATLSFLIFSSYLYIQNYVYFGNPAGPGDIVSSSVGRSTSTLGLNISRLIYQSVDFSGLPDRFASIGNRTKAKVMEGVNTLTGLTLEVDKGNAQDQAFKYRDFLEPTEDTSWFGFGSLVILIPAVLIALSRSMRKKEIDAVALVAFSLIFLPVETYLRWGWDPYQGRYFIAAVGSLAPLMFVLVDQKRFSKVLQWFTMLVVLSSFAVTTLYNPSKPLKSSDVKLFSADHAKLQSLAGGNALWRFSYMINRTLPEDAVVAYYAPDLIYDYVLFGEYFTRTVIPIADPHLLSDDNWLYEQGIDCVLVDLTADLLSPLSEKWVPFDEVKDKWLLLTRSKRN